MRSLRWVLVTLLATPVLVTAPVGPASAATFDPSPGTLSAALLVDSSTVTNASYVIGPPNSSFSGSSAISTDLALAGFPREGSSYAVLSSGYAYNLVNHVAAGMGEDHATDGGSSHGAFDYDTTVFKVDVDVPSGRNCAAVDLQFFTGEDPTSLTYLDGFVMELDTSTWTATNASPPVTAPDAVAVITAGSGGIATAGTSVVDNRAHGTALLTASVPITSGPHSFYFSILDTGDHTTNSDVLLDNLRFTSVASPGTQCVKGLSSAITNTSVPTVSGEARVGSTLVAGAGAWSSTSSLTYGYQWLRSGSPIAGATSTSYNPVAADVGTQLSVTVTAANGGSVQATSGPTAAVAPGKLTSAKPTIKGVAVVGGKLKAKPGTWGPNPVGLTYRWFRGSKAIKGATGKAYKPTAQDKGKKLKVTVTGTLAGYTTVSQTSASTKKVADD